MNQHCYDISAISQLIAARADVSSEQSDLRNEVVSLQSESEKKLVKGMIVVFSAGTLVQRKRPRHDHCHQLSVKEFMVSFSKNFVSFGINSGDDFDCRSFSDESPQVNKTT